MGRLWRFLLEDGWRLEPEGEKGDAGNQSCFGDPEGAPALRGCRADWRRASTSERDSPGGDAGQTRPRDDVKYSATATGTTVAKLVGEVRPVGIAKQRATTEPDIAVFSGEAGPSWSRAKGTPSAVDTAVAMLAGEARPPGIAAQSATTEPELAESPDETGPSGSRAKGDRAAAAADAKSASEARFSRFVNHNATSK